MNTPYAYALVLYSCTGGLAALALVWALVRLIVRNTGWRK